MSAVTEALVREYFEMMGFLVSQPRKYTVPGRQKKADEEVDLVVQQPTVREHRVPQSFEWTSADLKGVGRAVVGIRGWHSERFYASTFTQSPDILRFLEPDSLKFASRILGSASMAKVLCIPKLPASGGLKDKTIKLLRNKGIDGVITFRTILAELALAVDVKKNYEKSDVLQVIRLLKNYDLLKDTQLDFFTKKRRRDKGKTGA